MTKVADLSHIWELMRKKKDRANEFNSIKHVDLQENGSRYSPIKQFLLTKVWKYVLIAAWFTASLFFFGYLLNRGNTDLTKEMAPATLPVICVRENGHDFNRMFGYTTEMDYSVIRDGITPLEEGRKLNVRVYKMGEKINGISYELRSIDKERYVEEGEVTTYTQTSEYMDLSFAFKDIISEKTDYSLKIILTLENDRKVYYYARIFEDDSLNFSEKLDYVYYFNECTFNKETAQDEIGKYMESNSSGDNTNFAHVDIHSSMDQVTWGSLDVKRVDEPVCTVGEIDSKNALMKLEYTVSALTGEEERLYAVTEYYRFIKGTDRMYLLSFDRYMNTILFADKGVVYNDKLMLGIMPEEFEHAESEDGNTYAFVNNKSLFVVNSAQNTFGTAYSFYDKDNFDARCINPEHDIKILRIDESGNVFFYVYGYFNRGDYEGKCGIHLFEYNSKTNVVVEKIFIECDKPYEILKNEIGKLSYANYKNEFYFYFDQAIHKVNIEEQTEEIIVDNLKNEALFVAPSYKNCAWISKEDSVGISQITFLDMERSETFTINAKSGEHIKPMGFMGEDLIYGDARNADIYVNIYRETIVPMYRLNIINRYKEILKTYSYQNIYVLGCKINDNLITLTRNEKNEDGELVSAPPDSIVNTLMEKTYKNNSEVVITENLKKIVQVTLKKEMDNKKIKFKTPKTEMYEGRRELILTGDATDIYYVINSDECAGIFTDISQAVKCANDGFGCVIDSNGHYIWKKEAYSKTNQIMRIDGMEVADEETSSMEACLEKILDYEGFSLDVKNDLTSGMTYAQIIEKSVPNAKGVELVNCSPELIKYYLNKDIPVIAESESNSVLVIGYSDSVYVWVNPGSGNLMKVGRDEAETFYENNGNAFVAYVKWDS